MLANGTITMTNTATEPLSSSTAILRYSKIVDNLQSSATRAITTKTISPTLERRKWVSYRKLCAAFMSVCHDTGCFKVV